MERRSYLLTSDVTRKAVEMVLPAIQAMMDRGQARAPHLHIVVMDPTKRHAHGWDFNEAILFESQIGRPEEWKGPYDQVARSKARVSWRTGRPSHLVQQRVPYLYQEGDTKFGGSVVCEGGLVVAASGVEWYYDQLFAGWIAAACQALCIKAMQEVISSNIRFLGQEA